MATVDITDAAGSTVAIEKPLAPGRAAAGASRPVVLSAEDLAALATLVGGRALSEPLGQPSIARQLTVTVSSESQALTTTCRRASITAVGCAMRYVISTGSPTASATTSHYIADGERLDVACPASCVIAAIRDDGAAADGVLHISELI